MPATAEDWIDPRAEACRDAVLADWAGARRGAPRHFRLPGLALTAEGAAAGPLCRAFAHLAEASAPEGAPLAWRVAEAGELFPPPEPLGRYGTLRRSAANDLIIEWRPGMVSVCEVAARRITTVLADPEKVPGDFLAKPLLPFLVGLLHAEGFTAAHAALVGRGGRGLLVTGRGGLGKSTIAAAALRAGFEFCGDDFVALRRGTEGFEGLSLYCTLLLRPQQAKRLGLAAGPPSPEGKSLVHAAAAFPGQVRRSMRIEAVAVPEISLEPGSALRPAGRGAALRALAPSSIFASPWREASRAGTLFDLVAAVPALVYQSGRDPARIADPLKERYGD